MYFGSRYIQCALKLNLAQETMTDKVPFPGLSELRVMYAVAEQMQTPSRPDNFISVKNGYDNILWSLLESCWAYEPAARPTASAVRDIVSNPKSRDLNNVELRIGEHSSTRRAIHSAAGKSSS
jgi:hypothetical protein